MPFHIVGGKCKQCDSYNTTRVGDELIDNHDKIETAANADLEGAIGELEPTIV